MKMYHASYTMDKLEFVLTWLCKEILINPHVLFNVTIEF